MKVVKKAERKPYIPQTFKRKSIIFPKFQKTDSSLFDCDEQSPKLLGSIPIKKSKFEIISGFSNSFGSKLSSFYAVDKDLLKMPTFNFTSTSKKSPNPVWRHIASSVLNPFLPSERVLLREMMLKHGEILSTGSSPMNQRQERSKSIKKGANLEKIGRHKSKSFEMKKNITLLSSLPYHYRRNSCYYSFEGFMTEKQKKFKNLKYNFPDRKAKRKITSSIEIKEKCLTPESIRSRNNSRANSRKSFRNVMLINFVIKPSQKNLMQPVRNDELLNLSSLEDNRERRRSSFSKKKFENPSSEHEGEKVKNFSEKTKSSEEKNEIKFFEGIYDLNPKLPSKKKFFDGRNLPPDVLYSPISPRSKLKGKKLEATFNEATQQYKVFEMVKETNFKKKNFIQLIKNICDDKEKAEINGLNHERSEPSSKITKYKTQNSYSVGSFVKSLASLKMQSSNYLNFGKSKTFPIKGEANRKSKQTKIKTIKNESNSGGVGKKHLVKLPSRKAIYPRMKEAIQVYSNLI